MSAFTSLCFAITLHIAGSAVGAEGEVLTRQIARFTAAHPDVDVEIVTTPDSGDQRHQLYVQWLNAGASSPDVLQIDVVWTAELGAAGWIAPLPAVDEDFFAPALEAARWQGRLYAVPLFVDVGMLYYRSDLVEHPPRTLVELEAQARAQVAAGKVRFGLVTQAARYEGLVTAYLESGRS